MALIRLIIFALVVWLVWRMFQNYQVKQEQRRQQAAGERRLDQGRMVRCEYCSVHLPQSAAVCHDEHWFCNHQHKARFLEGGRD